ncbi:MAG: efflux transporter outer membrane subunit [Pseudomonadota bacterium]
MTRHRVLLCVSALAFALSGCASLTSDEEVVTATRASLPPLPAQWQVDGALPGDIRIGWIDTLGDPALSAFVREAQIANRDIQATAANVEAAYALVRQARSELFPAIDLSVTGGQSQVFDEPGVGDPPSEAFFTPDYDVSLQASWEADLWGRVRAGRNAAYASAQAIEADFRFAQYSLAASVASAYFAVIEAERQIDVAERNYAAYAEIDRITRFRAREGYSNQQDVRTAASDLADVLEGLEDVRGARRIAIRALEVLLGRYPGAEIEGGFDFPVPPPPPPAGLPSELLERRPDVIAAERNVAAAFSDLDQAKAARLPVLSLTGSVGGTSSELEDLTDGRNLFWSIIGNVLQPIFDAGLRGARVDEADADKRAAIATYASTALAALQDVEDNLDQVEVVRLREEAARTARDEAVEAVKLGELRYKEGETDLIDLLSLRQRQLSTEQNFVSIQRERIDQWVSLNLALGGSWIEPSQQAEP